jgi:ADP-heptose:LPS heptosyltransferase
MAIIANSNLFLGVDSFWAHAATALRVKALVLFGDTSPNHFGHDSNLNIYKKVSCSPCIDWIHGYSCPYSKKCMELITVEDVVNKIKSFLQKSPK